MKLLRHIGNLQEFKNDPLGFIVDTLITIVVNLIIPIPLAGRVVAEFRGPVLGCLASLIVMGLFLLFTIGTLLISLLLIPSGFFQRITLPASISSEEGFTQTSVPSRNPLGGSGMSNTSITAGFMDLGYFLQFGRNHTGIDLVPNDTYFKESKIYKETNKVLVLATHTGTALIYIDKNGGETVEVTNNDSSLKTIYIHFKTVYVKTGDTIKAGQPLGEMGKTGFATGEHVHYEVRVKAGSSWLAVNPINYIK